MEEQSWRDEYRSWKTLSPSQTILLEQGAKSLSQTWLLNQMWCEWKEIKKLKETKLPTFSSTPQTLTEDPWDEFD